MVKNTEDSEVSERRGFGVDEALGVVDAVFGDWTPIVWKAGVFYALWIGLAYLTMTNVTGAQTAQFAAIGYWFGWLFLAMTALLGVFIGVSGWLDGLRRSRQQSKY